MQRHAHSDGRLAPLFGRQRLLGGQCGRQGFYFPGENGTECIATSIKDPTAVCLDGLSHQDIVSCQGSPHCLRVLFPEHCAALYIGKQKG